MNKTETSRVSLIEQPNCGCSCYVGIRDVLGKIEGTAAVFSLLTFNILSYYFHSSRL